MRHQFTPLLCIQPNQMLSSLSSTSLFKYYNGTAFVTVFEVATNAATATIPSTVSIEGESDPNAIPFAIALGG